MGKNKGNLNLPPITLTKYRFGMIATTLHLGKRGEKTVQIKKKRILNSKFIRVLLTRKIWNFDKFQS
jgi:hypothetical protein